MLHHHHRIAEVAQPLHHRYETLRITRMQPDARFIQYIHRTDQRTAQRIGQMDALRLPARKRARSAVQTQIRHAHLQQIRKPLPDFGQHTLGHRFFVAVEFKVFEESVQFRQRHFHEFLYRFAAHLDIGRIGPQTRALALRTARPPAVTGRQHAVLHFIGLTVHKLEPVVYALHAFAAFPQQVFLRTVQVLIGAVHGKIINGRIAQERLFPRAHLGTAPTGHGILINGKRRVGNDEFLALAHDLPRTAARLACAIGVVERKKVGTGLDKRHAVGFQAVGKRPNPCPLPAFAYNATGAFPLVERRLHRIEDPRIKTLVFRMHRKAIDEQTIAFVQILPRRFRHIVHAADGRSFIGVQPAKTHHFKPFHFMTVKFRRPVVGRLGPQRRQHIDFEPGRQATDEIGHVTYRMPAHFLPRHRRIQTAYACVQQFQVFVNLGHGAYRRTRILAQAFLLDGDGRCQTRNEIDLRFAHAPQKLAGVCAEAFHIPPLPFRIQRIEYQRRFAGARKPRHNHQSPGRELETDVFEIVDPNTTQFNITF